MTYTIGYRYTDYGKEAGTHEFATAAEALTEAEKMQMSDVRIEYMLTMDGFRRLYKAT
jgi:hypothetical protein